MKEIDLLGNLLERAVKKNCNGKVGVLFSGGLDSTLIALIASKFSEVASYTVGIGGSPDLEYATRLQNALCFDIKIQEVSKEEIESSILPVLRVVKKPNPVQVGVGIPVYLASRKAGEDGLGKMFSGQGADELFGGYNRYLEILKDKGYAELEKAMELDLDNIHRDNLDRDIALCRNNGVELVAPYLDSEFVQYSLSIPVDEKVKEIGGEMVRKYILRELASAYGAPEFIINRRKKAAQYGSGVQKILDKLAREHSFKKKAKEAGRGDYLRMYLESLVPGN